MKKILVLMMTAVLLCAAVLAFSSCNKGGSDDDGGVHTHTMSEWTIESEVSCTTDGKEVRKCTDEGCNHTETRITPALGHDLKSVEGKEPTCVENGYKPYQKCTRCVYSTYKEIDAVEHDYTLHTELNPNGDKCVNCGQMHIHKESDFENWHTVENATCADFGSEERKCTVCNYVEEKSTPKLNHTIGDDGKCTGCGDVDSDAPEGPEQEF